MQKLFLLATLTFSLAQAADTTPREPSVPSPRPLVNRETLLAYANGTSFNSSQPSAASAEQFWQHLETMAFLPSEVGECVRDILSDPKLVGTPEQQFLQYAWSTLKYGGYLAPPEQLKTFTLNYRKNLIPDLFLDFVSDFSQSVSATSAFLDSRNRIIAVLHSSPTSKIRHDFERLLDRSDPHFLFIFAIRFLSPLFPRAQYQKIAILHSWIPKKTISAWYMREAREMVPPKGRPSLRGDFAKRLTEDFELAEGLKPEDQKLSPEAIQRQVEELTFRFFGQPCLLAFPQTEENPAS